MLNDPQRPTLRHHHLRAMQQETNEHAESMTAVEFIETATVDLLTLESDISCLHNLHFWDEVLHKMCLVSGGLGTQ